ncbi:MAG: hypothetical protein B7Z73_14465, partial [Planctomycetia bacterium 21-64-5]
MDFGFWILDWPRSKSGIQNPKSKIENRWGNKPVRSYTTIIVASLSLLLSAAAARADFVEYIVPGTTL